MSTALLQAIYDLGQQMYEALEAEDLEAFHARMAERTRLIEQLAAGSPPPLSAEVVSLRDALATQQAHLERALEAHERRLTGALHALVHERAARQSYRTRPPRRSLLNKNLLG